MASTSYPFTIDFPSLETYCSISFKIDLQELWISPNYMLADIWFSCNRWINVVLFQVAVVFIGERRLLVILFQSAAHNRVFAKLFLSP